MQDANILDGNILVIDRAEPWKVEKIVVCIINVNGEFTVKTLNKDELGYHLSSAAKPNQEYPQKIYIHADEEATIWGVVTYIIHKA